MEIDPKKIDFSKMVPIQNQDSGNSVRPEESAMSVKPGSQDQVQESGVPSQTPKEQNVFSGDVLWDGKKLFDSSLDMYKYRLGTFFTLIIMAIAAAIVMDLVISLPMSLFINPGNVSQINIVNLFLLNIVMSVIASIPSMVFSISIIEVIKDQDLSVSESIKKAFAKFKRYILAMATGNFASFGLILIVPAIIVIQILLSGGDFSLESETISWSYLTGFAGFLFVLPLLYIVEVWIFIALLGVVLDGLSPFEAFSYSYELFRGKASQIVWRMIGLSIRLAIYSIVILIIFSISAGISAGIIIGIAGEGSFIANAVTYIVSYIEIFIQLMVVSFVLIYQYNIYENLKAMKKDLAPDYKTRNQGKIKMIAGLGVLLSGLFITVLIYFSPAIDDLYRKELLKQESLKKEIPSGNTSIPSVNDVNSDITPKVEQENKNNAAFDAASGRDSKRKADLGTISLMIYEYKYKMGNFPISPSTVKLNENNSIVAEIRSINGEEIPPDPKDPEYYYGYTSVDGGSFELTSRLEDMNDSGCDQNIRSICLYRIKY